MVEDAAERARGDDVHIELERFRGRGPAGVELVSEPALALVDVADHEPGARLGAALGDSESDVAEPDHGDRPLFERARREHALAAGANRGFDAQGRVRTGIARPALAAWKPDDVCGALGNHSHVAAGGADIFGGDVAAAEGLDRVGEVEQRRGSALG